MALAARERDDARGGLPARAPHLDRGPIAIAAARAAPARLRGQRQVRDITLCLVTAALAFNENGLRVAKHGERLAPPTSPPARPGRRHCTTRGPDRPFGLSGYPSAAGV